MGEKQAPCGQRSEILRARVSNSLSLSLSRSGSRWTALLATQRSVDEFQHVPPHLGHTALSTSSPQASARANRTCGRTRSRAPSSGAASAAARDSSRGKPLLTILLTAPLVAVTRDLTPHATTPGARRPKASYSPSHSVRNELKFIRAGARSRAFVAHAHGNSTPGSGVTRVRSALSGMETPNVGSSVPAGWQHGGG